MLRLRHLLERFEGNYRIEIYGRTLLLAGTKEDIFKDVFYGICECHGVKAVSVGMSRDSRCSPIFKIYLDD